MEEREEQKTRMVVGAEVEESGCETDMARQWSSVTGITVNCLYNLTTSSMACVSHLGDMTCKRKGTYSGNQQIDRVDTQSVQLSHTDDAFYPICRLLDTGVKGSIKSPSDMDANTNAAQCRQGLRGTCSRLTYGSAPARISIQEQVALIWSICVTKTARTDPSSKILS